MSTRDQIAEQAWGVLVARGMSATDASITAHAIARNQLPLVNRLCSEAAAEALHRAADGLSDWQYAPTGYLRDMARAAVDHSGQPAPCGAYSNGTDGWSCAATGPHDQHHNAAGDVHWGDA